MIEDRKTPDGWERLVCSCGQQRFAKVVSLRWRQAGGVSEEPMGYFCMECHALVDSAALIQRAQYRAKQRELKDLESELRESGTEPPSRVAAKKGG